MRAVVTRVKSASVLIEGNTVGKIDKGLLVLLGVHKEDTPEKAKWMADRICGLRIFDDDAGKMNINPKDAGAKILIVSQFTLYADVSSRRPDFFHAARPEAAIPLYELVIEECRKRGFVVETGEFGAIMMVESVNDGPVTILIDR
ncbi:MAG: D-tyrosyl-tRNA(Tyr) deacylase [Blautia sp.]|nr:D-tyrosyl-tRNA(Tyr) deacylase [Blautia sp.]